MSAPKFETLNDLLKTVLFKQTDKNDNVTNAVFPNPVQIGLDKLRSSLRIFGGVYLPAANVTFDSNTGNINLKHDDLIVAVSISGTPGTNTLFLPSTPNDGEIHLICDNSGLAATIPINLSPNSSSITIDGATTKQIKTNYGYLFLQYFDSIKRWKVLATNDIIIQGQAGGDLIYFTGSAWTRLPIGIQGQVLGVSGGIPSWVNTASYIFDVDTPTNGDLLYYSGSWHSLTVGSIGQVLGISGSLPKWVNTASYIFDIDSPTNGDVLYYNNGWHSLAHGSVGQVVGIIGTLPAWVTTGSIPTGPAGGDLSGSYPNPNVGNITGMITGSAVGPLKSLSLGGSAASTGLLRLSTGSNIAVKNDPSNGDINVWSHDNNAGHQIFGATNAVTRVVATTLQLSGSSNGVFVGTATTNQTYVGGWIQTTISISGNRTLDTTTNDCIIFVDTSANPVTITLPTPANGRRFTVKDIKGTFATNHLTIAQHASEKIEGVAASKVISTNWWNADIVSNGTDYFVLL